MFVINKKRIIFLTLATFLPIGMFVLQTASNINTNKTVATMATPVSSKTIIIDAGHGGEDERDKMLKLKNKTLQMAIYQRNILVG